MKEYFGRTGLIKWLYIHEDTILIAVFITIPAVIFVSILLYVLWRF